MIAATGPSAADALAAGFARAEVRVLSIERTDPLPAGRYTTAALPGRVDVAIQSADVDLITLSDVALTAASVALGDYRVDLDDVAGRVVLTQAGSPFVTTIWSDGRFKSGEMAEARFWGTVSLELAGGAFVTAATAPRPDNPDAYALDRLVITKGAAALIIQGVGGGAGDMTVDARLGGWAVEEATADGLVLVDGGTAGWRQEDETLAADAAYLALTAVGGEWGPDSGRWSGREFGRVVTAFNRMLVSNITYSSLSRASNQVNDAVRDDGRESAARRAGDRTRALLRAAEHAAQVRGGDRAEPDLAGGA